MLGSATAATTGKSGYFFTYTSASPNAIYTITANAIAENQTGVRHFITDQSGVIRQNSAATASVTDWTL
ncbi:MAG TPA: hypothetical protein VKR82_07230 [Candidatus Acidoferrales bacterium]|nr:hypothetical protein [Candidatus Acidoferrales bacterium]